MSRRAEALPNIPLWRMTVNRAHSLSADLRFFIVCQGGRARDLVTGAWGVVSGQPVATPTRDGIAADLDSSDYFDFGNRSAHDITGDLTVVWRGHLDSGVPYVGKSAFDAGANTPFRFDGSGGNYRLVRVPASDFRIIASGRAIATGLVTVGVTCPASDFGLSKFYENGTDYGNAGGSGGATTATAGGTLRIGRSNDTTPQQTVGRAHVAAGWARVLSAAQMAEIHRDVYRLIADSARPVVYAGTSPPPPPSAMPLFVHHYRQQKVA